MSREERARHEAGLEEEEERKRRIAGANVGGVPMPGMGAEPRTEAMPMPGAKMGGGPRGPADGMMLGGGGPRGPAGGSSTTEGRQQLRLHALRGGAKPVGLAGLFDADKGAKPLLTDLQIETLRGLLPGDVLVLEPGEHQTSSLEISSRWGGQGPTASGGLVADDLLHHLCATPAFVFWHPHEVLEHARGGGTEVVEEIVGPPAAPQEALPTEVQRGPRVAFLWSPDTAPAKSKMKLNGLKTSLQKTLSLFPTLLPPVLKEARDEGDLKEILLHQGGGPAAASEEGITTASDADVVVLPAGVPKGAVGLGGMVKLPGLS